jgi:hypothetical protein
MNDFVYGSNVCGLGMEVRRDGKHTNFHVFDSAFSSGITGGFETFESIETAIPKLAALLAAAYLAQDAT